MAQDLRSIAKAVKSSDQVATRALNRGMDFLFTRLKRASKEWTGMRTMRDIAAHMRKHPASEGRWEAAVRVQSPWTFINELYNARFLKRFKAVGHKGWNRQQRAARAFILPGQTLALKRVKSGDGGLEPLYGPNIAREWDRHAPYVRMYTVHTARKIVLPEIRRLIERQLAKHAKKKP